MPPRFVKIHGIRFEKSENPCSGENMFYASTHHEAQRERARDRGDEEAPDLSEEGLVGHAHQHLAETKKQRNGSAKDVRLVDAQAYTWVPFVWTRRRILVRSCSTLVALLYTITGDHS